MQRLVSIIAKRRDAGSYGPLPAFAICVIVLLIVGSAMVSMYLPLAMRKAALDAAVKGNVEIIDQVKLMRGYYTQQIVSRALASKALTPSMHHAGKPNEIPLPATLVKDLSDLMSKQETTLNLVSPYPWPHRSDRLMDEFETGAWVQFQQDPDRVVSDQSVVGGKNVLRVAVSDRMTSETCVNCHNSDPQSVKRDWKKGDVRAVFEVSRVIDSDLAAADDSSRVIVWAISIGAFVGCAAILVLLVIFERRSRDKRLADQNAYYLAEHDPLTGLKNRAYLRKVLDKNFGEQGHITYAALLLIDLDGFKPVNDTHGHAIGDELLAAVAERLRQWSHPGDLVARIGGDEFAIAIKTAPPPDVLHAELDMLCHRMNQPFEFGEVVCKVGVSAGVALAGVHAQNMSDLFIAADLALYSAKGNGKGRWRMFEAEMTASALRRVHFEADMRVALAENQFHLHYQPIRDAQSGKIVKVEALLRWHHPTRGNVGPAEFIPIAEEVGLIEAIGTWVLRRACTEIAAFGHDLKVAVNLSTRQLANDKLLQLLKNVLAETGLEPHRLELEITESTMLKQEQRTLDMLRHIRELGVEIAIDDFGTGYSCLSYLQTYPVTGIKIDRSFVDPLGKVESSKAIVAAIIALARALNLKTVAEGVETAAHAEELLKMGCNSFQGYYFDRPRPLDMIDIGAEQTAA